MTDDFKDLPEELQVLYETMQDDLYDGMKDEVVEATRAALDQWRQTPAEILQRGLVTGMDMVGADFRGHSAIYAPVEMTDDRRGILAQTQDATPQILFADLDLEKLRNGRRAYPILDLMNPAVNRQLAEPKEP